MAKKNIENILNQTPTGDQIKTGFKLWNNLKNADVATWKKVLFGAAVVGYAALPVDFVPDVIPILGHMDDVAVIALMSKFFNNAAAKDIQKAELERQNTNTMSGVGFEYYSQEQDYTPQQDISRTQRPTVQVVSYDAQPTQSAFDFEKELQKRDERLQQQNINEWDQTIER